MPTLDGEALAGAAGAPARVAPSAPLELFWLLHWAAHGTDYTGRPPIQTVIAEIGPERRELWAGGAASNEELAVLADRSETLFDLDCDVFLARLEAAATARTAEPTLATELPESRRVTIERLERLRHDGRLRARYLGLLRRTWELARTEWQAAGRPAVEEAAASWRRRLRDGATVWDLFGGRRDWFGRPRITEMVDEAVAQGRLVISPGWYFGRIHVMELSGTLYLGGGVQPAAAAGPERRRAAAEQLMVPLKAMADPTRLAILLQVAHRPSTVTALAEGFGLSQPTVSQHVRQLRQAGLLDPTSGRRLASSPARLKQVLEQLERDLVKWSGH